MVNEIKEYARSFSFTRSVRDGTPGQGTLTAYEDIDGILHASADGGIWTPPSPPGPNTSVWPLMVKKTYYSETPVISVMPGVPGQDTFTVPKNFGATAWGSDYNWPTVTVRCTSAAITDEIVRFVSPNTVVRLWEITLEGVTQGFEDPSGISVKRLSIGYDSELNGVSERTVSGRLVFLLNSSTPMRRLRIEGTGRIFPCPKKAGDPFEFFLSPGLTWGITRVSTRRNMQENEYGAITATLYDYEIEAEL